MPGLPGLGQLPATTDRGIVSVTLPMAPTGERIVLCMKWGTKYGPEYVNRLYGMVRRHLRGDFRFVCLTDRSDGVRLHHRRRQTIAGKFLGGCRRAPEIGFAFFGPPQRERREADRRAEQASGSAGSRSWPETSRQSP